MKGRRFFHAYVLFLTSAGAYYLSLLPGVLALFAILAGAMVAVGLGALGIARVAGNLAGARRGGSAEPEEGYVAEIA